MFGVCTRVLEGCDVFAEQHVIYRLKGTAYVPVTYQANHYTMFG